MFKYAFKKNQGNHTLFTKHSSQCKVTTIIVCVNDIVLTGNDMEEMESLKRYFAKEFEIKDLGQLKYF